MVENKKSHGINDGDLNRVIVSDRYRFVYVPIPKCASTSMLEILVKLHDLDETEKPRKTLAAVVYGPTTVSPDAGCAVFQLENNKIGDFVSRYDDYYWFTIVRDPQERIVSNYKNRINHFAKHKYKLSYAISTFQKLLYPLFGYKNPRDARIESLVKLIPFPKFINDLACDGLDWNQHLKLQSSFLEIYNRKFDYVGNLATFNDDFLKIAQSINVDDEHLARLLPLPVKNSSTDVKHQWEERDLETVKKIYARDFALINR